MKMKNKLRQQKLKTQRTGNLSRILFITFCNPTLRSSVKPTGIMAVSAAARLFRRNSNHTRTLYTKVERYFLYTLRLVVIPTLRTV